MCDLCLIFLKLNNNNFYFSGHGRSSLFVRAQEDEAEGEETDDGAVEDEDGGSEVENEEAVADEEETNKNVHKDADTQLLFTKPSIISTFESGSVELPAGKVNSKYEHRNIFLKRG